MKFCSIIMVHHTTTELRSSMMRESLATLFEKTKYPFELIVVDNGGNQKDSEMFFDFVEIGKINTYIRNSSNMHFGYARNQALCMASGDYIAIVDNDIRYLDDWLTACINVLETYPNEKIYATPVQDDTHKELKFWGKNLPVDNLVYRTNMRAGSNCFVIRRNDFKEIGDFECHRVAGTKWTNMAVAKGYFAAITPLGFAEDMGLRIGYDLKKSIPISIKLSNGQEVYLNTDEFRKGNPGLFYL